jgi:hypothetical protein
LLEKTPAGGVKLPDRLVFLLRKRLRKAASQMMVMTTSVPESNREGVRVTVADRLSFV